MPAGQCGESAEHARMVRQRHSRCCDAEIDKCPGRIAFDFLSYGKDWKNKMYGEVAMTPDLNAHVRRIASAMLLPWCAACAHPELHSQACLSGVDVYEDIAYGANASRITFSGSDSGAGEPCGDAHAGQGGYWVASFDQTAPPPAEPGAAVNPDMVVEAMVIGGEWHWWQVDGTLQSGYVTGGQVLRPADPRGSIGICGNGAAMISVTLSVHQQYPGSGTFEGCLDDTRVDTTMPWVVHPPSIRGSLRMNSP
jgi:hypothetical protein